MNILFLAPRLPLPADTGGKIRTLNILKELAKVNHVHLLCFSFEQEDQNFVKELELIGITVGMVSMPETSFFNKITSVLFDPIPFSISKYDLPQMRQAIAKVLKTRSFDAIHIDHLHMGVYRNCFGSIPCFLDEHNVEYKILERCAGVEKSVIKKWIYRNQTAKMMAFESKKIREFSGVFACSSDDQIMLSSLIKNDAPVHVIPNGVDTEFFNPTQSNQQENALVFTGSMDWLPNDDAITYFCKEILPLLWQKDHTLKLYVVGKNPSASVKELSGRDKRVIVTGRVDDVRPFVEGSKVFIVPLRVGGGTRLKILEAMAMGKAVVSTRIGAEGIECADGVNIALADTPDDFTNKIIDLLKQPDKVVNMGQEGRKLVCQQYDWAIVGKKLNSIYQKDVHAT